MLKLITYFLQGAGLWKADCHSAIQKCADFFMEPEDSSLCSQTSATGPYSEPAESISSHAIQSPLVPS